MMTDTLNKSGNILADSDSVTDEKFGAVMESSVQLFDGKRVEEFLINDEKPWNAEKFATPEEIIGAGHLSYLDQVNSPMNRVYQEKVVGEVGMNGSQIASSSHSGSSISRDIDHQQAAELADSTKEAALGNIRTPIRYTQEQLEERDSLLSMLSSLTDPTPDTRYLEAYGTCLSYILHIWTEIPSYNKVEHLDILSRLEGSLHQAETLRRNCNVESVHIPSGQSLPVNRIVVSGADLDRSTLESELRSLGDTVQEAIALLQRMPDMTDDMSLHTSSSLPQNQGSVPLAPGNHTETRHHTQSQNTPPFLTWAWLNSGFERSIPAPRLAAENLFTIMQDIDRHLCRNNDFYTRAPQATIAELTGRIAATRRKSWMLSSMGQPGGNSPTDVKAGLLAVNELLSPHHEGAKTPSADDAILQLQKDATVAVVSDIIMTAQKFVALFIPCTYQHPVSKRIWGSLSGLLRVSTFISLSRTTIGMCESERVTFSTLKEGCVQQCRNGRHCISATT
jgi:hypothetical protein